MPKGENQRNITASLNEIYIGRSHQEIKMEEEEDGGRGITKGKYDYVQIEIPVISTNTFKEIISLNFNKTKKVSSHFKYLKLSRQTGLLKKSDAKNLIHFALSICPACKFSNNCQKKGSSCHKKTGKKSLSNFIKCQRCGNIFQTRHNAITFENYESSIFQNCEGWSCRDCETIYKNQYADFLNYLRRVKSYNGNDCGISLKHSLQRIFNELSDTAKAEMNYSPKLLYYSVKVQGVNKVIPPIAFLIETNKPASFYDKLFNLDALDVKTNYGSVNSRCQGGKNSIFRNNCLNKRYVISGRLVIVPRYQLQPHQCIMPDILYRRLNCPKHVLGHRYPTLDIRSMVYLEVVSTWEYPCLAISTAIVHGMNADFDGDCLHVIPANNIPSQAELLYLCHPMYNMIVQNRLRVQFDHDEIQTIYSEFGLNSKDIHKALLELVRKTSSPYAYNSFCNMRSYCHWVWEYKSIPAVSFKDFTEICEFFDEENVDYLKFINNIYPQIKPHNAIKEIINSQSSRFSIDHLWQIFGEISQDSKTGFLEGLTKSAFIKLARVSRSAIVKDVGLYGYSHIKLTHCTKSLVVGYDGHVYSTDGVLVSRNVSDIF